MPTTIETQTGSDELVAAYRPIIFFIDATPTTGPSPAPVVYCDIYFNNIFYKTISKTQSEIDGDNQGLFEFDIQDAAQEYLGKFLGANGGSSIVTAPPVITKVFCRFRASGTDADGFIEPEGTPPVQATGDTGATSGDGTESNTFYIVNATLQHEDNQDLASHLSSYKHRDWDGNVYPLTHRPDHYKICQNDSDYFPIVSDVEPTKLRIHYIPKGGTDYTTTDSDSTCVPVGAINPSLPNAKVGEAYSFSIPLSGTAPFELGSVTKPSWMDIAIDGSDLVFSGTPTGDDVGTHIEVTVVVSNCGGDNEVSFDKFINVTACVTVSFTDFDFPDATANVPYNKTVVLSGTAPFAIDTITTKPSWMNITLTGNSLQFTGTPSGSDVGTGIDVQLTLENCGGTEDITKTINVLESQNFILSAAYNLSIDSVTGSGIPSLGSTGTNGQKKGHQTGMSGSYAVTITGTPALPTTKLDIYVNNGLVFTQAVASAGTYGGPVTATEDDTVAFYINS